MKKFKILFIALLFVTASCTVKQPYYMFTIEDEYGIRSFQEFEGYQHYKFTGTIIVISENDTTTIEFNDYKQLNINKK